MHRFFGHDGHTSSIWTAGVAMPETYPLDADIVVDTCVVGAGIAGLSIAYELSAIGQRVAVIDAADIGGSQTMRTTAHLASALDDGFASLTQLHGPHGARLAAESHRTAIDRIEEIAALERIECDFARVDGYLFAGPDHDAAYLARERAAALLAGMPVFEEPGLPLPFDGGPCLRFANQAMFHPGRYVGGLASAVRARGGRLYPWTRATEIAGGPDAHVVTQHGYRITARAIVVATNVPINDRAVIHTKQSAYRSYAMAVEALSGVRVRPALFWDTATPYHYVRTFGDLLIVGGEDHKTGQESQPEACWDRLEAWTRERFGEIRVEQRWSGQIIEPVDGLAFIGRNPADQDNVYVATGDSGHGLTHGAIAGVLIRDLIVGRANPWTELYSPRRRPLSALGAYAKENLNVAAQYADWLKPGEARDPTDVPRGEGALVRQGAALLAVYVDEHGTRTTCSAACPHLGAVVHWNRAEKTWDCPCHGSRFAPTGEVVEGPAIEGLARVITDGAEKLTPIAAASEPEPAETPLAMGRGPLPGMT